MEINIAIENVFVNKERELEGGNPDAEHLDDIACLVLTEHQTLPAFNFSRNCQERELQEENPEAEHLDEIACLVLTEQQTLSFNLSRNCQEGELGEENPEAEHFDENACPVLTEQQTLSFTNFFRNCHDQELEGENLEAEHLDVNACPVLTEQQALSFTNLSRNCQEIELEGGNSEAEHLDEITCPVLIHQQTLPISDSSRNCQVTENLIEESPVMIDTTKPAICAAQETKAKAEGKIAPKQVKAPKKSMKESQGINSLTESFIYAVGETKAEAKGGLASRVQAQGITTKVKILAEDLQLEEEYVFAKHYAAKRAADEGVTLIEREEGVAVEEDQFEALELSCPRGHGSLVLPNIMSHHNTGGYQCSLCATVGNDIPVFLCNTCSFVACYSCIKLLKSKAEDLQLQEEHVFAKHYAAKRAPDEGVTLIERDEVAAEEDQFEALELNCPRGHGSLVPPNTMSHHNTGGYRCSLCANVGNDIPVFLCSTCSFVACYSCVKLLKSKADVFCEAAGNSLAEHEQERGFKRKLLDTQQIDIEFFKKARKSEFTDAFKEKVVQYALEVVPGGKGKGGARGTGEAALKYGVPRTTVRGWLNPEDPGCLKGSKSGVTDAFKEEVVKYAIEVVPGGKGKGGTRGIVEAARKFRVTRRSVQYWLQAQKPGFVKCASKVVPGTNRKCGATETNAQESAFVKVSKNDITEAFKEEVAQYALEVIPGGKGKGGTRGTYEAARKYGVPRQTVQGWLKAQASRFVKVIKSELTDAFKEEVVQCALEVVPGGKGKGGTRGTYEAARKYGVPRQTVQGWLKAQESVFIYASKSEITDTFKEEVVQYALEVVPGGKGKGGTRGSHEAARKYGVPRGTVRGWLKAKDSSGFVKISRSAITDAFKEEVVKYALEVVPGGRGKGGTRGSSEAALKYGVCNTAVHDWLKAQDYGRVYTNKSEFTDAFKEEVVQYALEVVPEGKGKGGTRGTHEAGIVYGIDHYTVVRWVSSRLGDASLANKLKLEVVGYVMDEAATTGNELMAITNASKKYSVEPAIIKGWIRHFQRSQNIYSVQNSLALMDSPAPVNISAQQSVPCTRIQPFVEDNENMESENEIKLNEVEEADESTSIPELSEDVLNSFYVEI